MVWVPVSVARLIHDQSPLIALLWDVRFSMIEKRVFHVHANDRACGAEAEQKKSWFAKEKVLIFLVLAMGDFVMTLTPDWFFAYLACHLAFQYSWC